MRAKEPPVTRFAFYDEAAFLTEDQVRALLEMSRKVPAPDIEWVDPETGAAFTYTSIAPGPDPREIDWQYQKTAAPTSGREGWDG